MQILTDLHTHTVASTHAYSTVTENCKAAAEKGLELIACTDHGPGMPDAPHAWHFENLKSLPKELYGVELLHGVECSVCDRDGKLDLADWLLDSLDLVIASIHTPAWHPSSPEIHTQMWLKVCQNPLVDILGHLGREATEFDIDAVVRAAKQGGKLIEINSHSFDFKPSSTQRCIEIAKKCKELEAPIAVNSDAHFWNSIGDLKNSIQVLKEIDFPEELIMNRDKMTIKTFLEGK